MISFYAKKYSKLNVIKHVRGTRYSGYTNLQLACYV
jgi:hypothetical protein